MGSAATREHMAFSTTQHTNAIIPKTPYTLNIVL